MRTSDEIYHRVRWDPRFDPARFVLGINQRGAAPKRVPLPSFVPGGDIPWHRIVFVEADGELLWDRATGVDRIDVSDAGRRRSPRLLRAPFFTARTPFRWEPAAGWRPAGDPPPAAAGSAARVRILTWNTLWDRYDGDRIETARRRPLLLASLAEADADVIALQEVEADLLTLLMRAPWVRAGYTLGTDPGGEDVADCGLLLLSRLPVREAGWHGLGPHKAVTALTVDTGGGPLVVATTHLTSDHSDDGPARRRAQLGRIAEGLGGVSCDLVLAGDFNDGGDAPAAALGLRDVWTEVHGPGDRTPTFDPGVNPLAAVSSLSGRASRLDRVFLRPGLLRAAGAVLRGDSPAADGLYVSDHYGVQADLEPATTGPAGEIAAAEATAGPAAVPDTASEAEDARARAIVRRLSEALGEGVVHLAGSRRMGCALAGADLDLVAALPGAVDPAAVRAGVTAALPDATRVRQVTGARVPGLRLRTDGLDVDLVVVATGALDPAEAVARRTESGEAAAIALSAVSDAEAVRAAVAGRHPAFARLATGVKAWAKARGLDSAPFGGLPGVAWSVLAARTVREAAEPAAPDVAEHFFGTWAAWDWRMPVALDAAATAPPAPVAILTPTEPVRTCTGQVTAGFRDLLADELYRAWTLLEQAAETGADPWPGLLAPPPLHRRHAAWAVLTVRRGGAGEFEETLGRVRGRLLALLAALADAGAADAHAWPRPFETGPGFARYAIGLGRTPPDAARLAEIAGGWCSGLRGVGVDWAAGGTVPALR
ncbi:RNA repair domain-containing protein [Streptomyces sp. NBC_01808]|uniref:poly(A) polymerase n=1 Tax=Streptomyces sp. NBC_01808 TaxID=2975947 RepID=UPI002DDA1E49|nr:poly(A) polymerase [Streptomyces sp. NBC_01808]WSA40809.1 RNA repair domain-containing protein [Streptomyces sp. NBC_01808]